MTNDRELINKRYQVNCFTIGTAENGKFPENTYFVDTPAEIEDIVKNCSREIAGIVKVEIWIEKQVKD